MNRSEAIAKLPETYATAVRLRDEHHADEAIAACLGIAVESVPPLLRVAAAKLNSILEADDQSPRPNQTVTTGARRNHATRTSPSRRSPGDPPSSTHPAASSDA